MLLYNVLRTRWVVSEAAISAFDGTILAVKTGVVAVAISVTGAPIGVSVGFCTVMGLAEPVAKEMDSAAYASVISNVAGILLCSIMGGSEFSVISAHVAFTSTFKIVEAIGKMILGYYS